MRPRPTRGPHPVAALGVFLLACGGDPVVRRPSSGGPIRLVDVVSRAEIVGEVGSPARSGEEAEEREVWAWRGGGGRTGGLVWRRGGCVETAGGLRCRADGGLTMRPRAGGAGLYRFEIEAEPAAGSGCAEVRWAEGPREVGSAALEDLVAGDGRYSLELYLSGQAGPPVASLRRLNVRGPCDLNLRSVVVHRTPLDRASLLARIQSLEPLLAPHHPLAVAGYLLPRGPANFSAPPFDENHTYREALLGPVPGRISFSVRLDPGARLSFSTGLHRTSRVGCDVRFVVRVEEEGREPMELLDQRLGAEKASWHWHDHRIDLGAWADRRVSLVLETDAAEDCLVLPVWGSPRIDFPRRGGEPPNVLLLAVDTLRADHLGSYGGPATPHLGELAEESLVFEEAIAQANWTLPSFASVLTGVTPARHGVLHPLEALPRGLPTLAEELRRRGWITEAVLYKPALDGGRDLERGFERYFNLPRIRHLAAENRAKAEAAVEDLAGRRFFLFVHFNDPHLPFTQPTEWVDRSTLDTLDRYGLRLPLDAKDVLKDCAECASDPVARAEVVEAARDLYRGEVAYLDAELGKLFASLRRAGVWDDTLIVLFSDHGELLFESPAPGLEPRYGHGGAHHPDALVRVPLLVKPAADGGGVPRRVAERVSLVDVTASLLSLAGDAALSREVDGRSLLPLLHGGGAPPGPSRASFSIGREGEALRWGPWTYSRSYVGAREARERIEGSDEAGSEDPRGALRALMADHRATHARGAVVLALLAPRGSALEAEVTAGPCRPRSELPFAPYGSGWSCGEGRWRLRAESSGHPWVLGLPLDEADRLAVEVRAGGELVLRRSAVLSDLPRYRPGALVEWQASPHRGAAVLLAAAEPALADEDVRAASVEEEQIEALRALGYLD